MSILIEQGNEKWGINNVEETKQDAYPHDCEKLAQEEYKKHDHMAENVHLELCATYGF